LSEARRASSSTSATEAVRERGFDDAIGEFVLHQVNFRPFEVNSAEKNSV